MTKQNIELLLGITDDLKVKYRDVLILDGIEILADVYVAYGYHPIVPMQNVQLVVDHYRNGEASYSDIIGDIVEILNELEVLMTPPDFVDDETRGISDYIVMIPLTLFISLYAIKHGDNYSSTADMLHDGLFDRITARLDRSTEGSGA